MNLSEPSEPTLFVKAYQQGAILKDLDLVRWLENKLGERSRQWAGKTCASIVSREMVEELMTCFSSVDHITKMKVILSFLYLSPRYSKQWKESLAGLLSIAQRDPDDWVEVVANLLRDVPMAGGSKTMTTPDLVSYRKMIDELTQCAIAHEEAGNLRISPPSFDACSRDVTKALFGEEPKPLKHFTLKKKPKSYTLQMEVKKQCENLINSKKDKREMAIISGTLPIKIKSTSRREVNNDLPMKGIPTQNTVKLSQGFSNEPKKFQRTLAKREGGAKLLDIGDLPLPFKQRRMAEQEDERKKAKEEKEQAKKAAAEERKAAAEAKRLALLKAKEEARIISERREQRKSLDSKAPLLIKERPAVKDNAKEEVKTKAGQPQAIGIKSPPQNPREALKSPPIRHVTASQSRTLTQQLLSPPHRQQEQALHHQQDDMMHQQQMQMQMQQQQHQPQQQQQQHRPQQQMQQPTQHLHHAQHQQQMHQQPIHAVQQQPRMQPANVMASHPVQVQRNQQPQTYSVNVQRPVIVRNFPGQAPIQIPGNSGMQMIHSQPPQQPQHQQFVIAPQIQPHGYSDFQDMDVARKCHEILSSANALEEKGRNVVLQFMKGGLRCNPSPSMDHIMTLKLSENIEDAVMDGRLQKMKVEVFFQMDLSNGEWKRLRKCRVMEGDELNAFVGQDQPQQSWSNHQQFQQNFSR